MITDLLTEWKALASFKNDPEALYTATRECFTGERQQIYDAMKKAYATYGEVSLVGTKEFFGQDLPAELTPDVRINPRSFINALVDYARRRQLEEAAEVLLLQSREDKPNEDKVRTALSFKPVKPSQDISLHTGVMHMQAGIMRKRNADYIFAKSSIPPFNAMLGGEWPRKSLTIIKALPGTGKTSLALNNMMYAANNGHPSHFWSLEMSKDQLIARALADRLSIDNTRISMGISLTEQELAAIENESIFLQGLPMTVNDNIPTLDDIINETHYLALQGYRLFFYDYIQIARVNKFGNKNQDLGYLAMEFKRLAKKYDVSFVALSQVNDQQEVRDSGEVEQVADVSIYLEADKDIVNPDGSIIVNARFDKNRFGPIGRVIPMIFNGSYQRFINYASYDTGNSL